MRLEKIGNFLQRSKIPIDIKDSKEYKRVTIRINHNGVSLRDTEIGKNIGTKKQFILKAGQFILSKIDARYGAFGIAPNEVEGAIITGNFWAYEVDSKKVNIEWFNQFTNSRNFYEICERASSGITHRKYLDEEFFLNYEIPLPSPEEQLKQIEKIKKQKLSFGELTSELSYQSELLSQLRQSFLREAMQGKLVKQDPKDGHAKDLLEKIKEEKVKSGRKDKELPPIRPEEIPFEIPENWVWCRLGKIVDLITSGSRDWAKYYSSEGAVFVRMGNLSRHSFHLRMDKIQNVKPPKNQEGKRTRLEEGDILVSITGEVGNLGLIPKYFGEAYINQHTALVRLNKAIVFYFIGYLLLSNFMQLQFNAPQRGMKNSFRLTDLENLLIPIPPPHEQKRIVKKLEELMKYCEKLQQSIQTSREQNEMLMQKVLKEILIT